MVANLLYIVQCIGSEHIDIVRIWTVSRVGKPEILPNHNSVTVASLVKFIVSSHSHPIADHSEMHICVVSHCDVILAGPIVQIDFRETPVAAIAYKTTAIDVDIQSFSGC